MILQNWLALILVAYVPGALMFRLPFLDRDRRASLAAEERAYWAVIISLLSSSVVALALAAADAYRLERVLLVHGVFSATVLALWRARLRLGPAAPPPGAAAVIPLLLLVLGWYCFFPPSEYVIGGRDPGVYFNQGIQIAQGGGLLIHDPTLAAVPSPLRHLFFPDAPGFFSTRFMGFFVLDPAQGTVAGLFPHLYPIWVAIGYGIHGVTGARAVTCFAAMLGVLSLYFAGRRTIGLAGAAVAASLLAINVVQIWFARYPNAEMVTQVLLFAGILAFARAVVDGVKCFAPLAGLLLGLALFARIDAIVPIGTVVLTIALLYAIRQPLPVSFLLGLAVPLAVAYPYYTRVLRPYSIRPAAFLQTLPALYVGALVLAAVALLALIVVSRRTPVASWLPAALPRLLVATVVGGAIYALYFRRPGGRLAAHDAASLVTFTWYVPPAALLAALLGYARLTWRSMWRDPALIVTVAITAVFVFYKMRIVPEHFWMTRRFVPMVLPSAVLMLGAVVLFLRYPTRTESGWTRRSLMESGAAAIRFVLVVAFVGLVGSRLIAASRPILRHVEYAGIIPALESLAGRFGDEDLVLVESRYSSELNAGDLHVLALPLAYVYARNVLVLHPLYPARGELETFIGWARTRYREIYFLSGGGTPVLSASVGAETVAESVIDVPEYEQRLDGYPRTVGRKKFVFGTYRLTAANGVSAPLALDIGAADDLHVIRFHAKERSGDVTFRWTHPASLVVLANVPAASRRLTLRLSDGGRPAGLPRPDVTVLLNDEVVGRTRVGAGFQDYSFPIRDGLLYRGVADGSWPQLRIVTSSTWSPRDAGVGGDGRALGVMIDRLDVR
jgi:hypothetical protein